ncbi:hypothetical protein, partial [Aneurinibacillus migulanus]|uniref:hypothetical protein n=1 Tax=Aneurinibacillus migulanus TaxID=47500 RepID=UPI001C3FB964
TKVCRFIKSDVYSYYHALSKNGWEECVKIHRERNRLGGKRKGICFTFITIYFADGVSFVGIPPSLSS